MYLKHFQLHHSPFAEAPDPDIFFPDAGRNIIYTGLDNDFRADKPLIRLIGAEGSGKTMLCRMLLRNLPGDDFDVIYLDNPIGSFDDLLHVICRDLAMEPSDDPDQDMLSRFRALLAEKKEQQKKVILIIDEAEKLFMASLERLLRTMCELNKEQVLQVLLSARPDLDENLDQLTLYCNDLDISTVYRLEPFTEQETAGYLNFRLNAAGLPPDSREQIFSSEAVHKIFESAKGNLRLINLLAEEALQASSTDKSFLVLLDHVSEQVDKYTDKPGWLTKLSPKTIQIMAAGITLVALSIWVFLPGGNEEDDKKQPVTVDNVKPEKDVKDVKKPKEKTVNKIQMSELQIASQDQPAPEQAVTVTTADTLKEETDPEIPLIAVKEINTEKEETDSTKTEPESPVTVSTPANALTPEETATKTEETIPEAPVTVVAENNTKEVEPPTLKEAGKTKPEKEETAAPVAKQSPVILSDDMMTPEDNAPATTGVEKPSDTQEEGTIQTEESVATIDSNEQTTADQDDVPPVKTIADPGVDPESYTIEEELPSETKQGLPILRPAGIVNLVPRMIKSRPEAEINDGLLEADPQQDFTADSLELEAEPETVAPVESPELINLFAKPVENEEVRKPAEIEQTKEVVQVEESKKTAPTEDNPPETAAPPETTELSIPSQDTIEPAAPATEQFYQKLLNAGHAWLANDAPDSHTIQLMALNSAEAVANLKEMLARDEYRDLEDKLIILQKNNSSHTLFVFYGDYDTMEQARNTRNTMPLYLRKHHPYALSRTDALKKLQN